MGVLKVEEATTSPNDDADLQWSAYVSSYQQMEWTEGVPHAISWPFLHKHVNMTPENAGEANVNADIPIHSDEQLVLRIDPLDYRIKWDPSTTDTWLHERPSRLIPKIGLSGTAESRKRKFEDKFEEQGLLRKKVRVEELATRLDWLEEGSVDQGVPALEVAAGEKDEEMQS
jgi:histone deacetylase complex regulatory component SIN3